MFSRSIKAKAESFFSIAFLCRVSDGSRQCALRALANAWQRKRRIERKRKS